MENQSPPRLSILAQRLIAAPTSLIALIEFTGQAADYNWFRQTVTQYLPDVAQDIFALPAHQQTSSFADHFERKYFPLDHFFLEYAHSHQEDRSPYSWLREGIPYAFQGIDPEEDLHMLWQTYSHAVTAMALIAAPPQDSLFFNNEDAPRVAWLESAREEIPVKILLKIPPDGIPTNMLYNAVEDTPLQAVRHVTDWAYAQTGNFFMDHPSCYPEQEPFDDWDQETIDQATQEWKGADVIIKSISTLSTWMEADLPGRFESMLDFILERVDALPKT